MNEQIDQPIGPNDTVYKWDEVRRTTYKGEARSLRKVVDLVIEDKLEHRFVGHLLVEFGADDGSISIVEKVHVVIHSAGA